MKRIVVKENSIHQGSNDYIRDYLLSVGIPEDQIMNFKDVPTEKCEDDPFLLDNMKQGLAIVKEMMDRGVKTFIQVDSDPDGYTSSAIFIQYFKKRYPNNEFIWRLQPGKEHGVDPKTVPADCELVVIPDAGSIQYAEQEELTNAGKTVIILDHHNVDDYRIIKGVTIINNQLGTFPNRYLCGAGVVYMFIKAFDHDYYPMAPIYKDYMDLTALGLISDMMDTRSVGNHYIIFHGLKNIKNKMFLALLKKQEFSINKMSKIDDPSKYAIAFYITPVINGLIRSGGQDEKELFFEGLITEDSQEMMEHTFRGKTTIEDIYTRAARLAANAKGRQDAGKKKSLEFLDAKIAQENLNDNQVLTICLDDEENKKVDQNITGLAAMAVLNRYNKPTLVLRHRIDENGVDMYCGSGRSKDFYGFRSLMKFVRESGLSCYTAGHDNAFGAWFTTDKLEAWKNYCNEKLASFDFEDCYEVDYYFHYYIDMNMLMEFARYDFLFGQGMSKPLFAFDLEVKSSELTVMKDEHLKIMQNGVSFIKFGCKDLIEELQKKDVNNVTIIGQASLNEWNGRTNVQIMVDDIFISEKQASKLASLI